LLSKGNNFDGGVRSIAEEHADDGGDGADEFGHGLTLVPWRDDRLKKAPAAERISLISNGSGSFGYTQAPSRRPWEYGKRC
jgi:hypothetical protein